MDATSPTECYSIILYAQARPIDGVHNAAFDSKREQSSQVSYLPSSSQAAKTRSTLAGCAPAPNSHCGIDFVRRGKGQQPAQRVDIGARPRFEQVAVEGVQRRHKGQHLRRRVGQIHVKVGGAAQELQLLEGARIAAGQRQLVGPATRPVDRIVVDGESFGREVHARHVGRPVANQRLFDFADDTGLHADKSRAPLIGELADRILVTTRPHARPFVAVDAGNIRRIPCQDRRNRGRVRLLGDGQRPQVAWGTRRTGKIQCLMD